MMLHNGRCGSTVVGDLLVQNPNIHWASELYAKLCLQSGKKKISKNQKKITAKKGSARGKISSFKESQIIGAMPFNP